MKKELYVVGLIPEPVKSQIFEYQKELSALYGLYDNKYPELHVTLARLDYEHQDQVASFSACLGGEFSTMAAESVEICGITCFGPPYKSVSLHVNTTPWLEKLSQKIMNAAKQTGLTIVSPFDTWQYHITVASPFFARREWPEEEYAQACSILESSGMCTSFVLDHIQLWYPVMEDYRVSSFILSTD